MGDDAGNADADEIRCWKGMIEEEVVVLGQRRNCRSFGSDFDWMTSSRCSCYPRRRHCLHHCHSYCCMHAIVFAEEVVVVGGMRGIEAVAAYRCFAVSALEAKYWAEEVRREAGIAPIAWHCIRSKIGKALGRRDAVIDGIDQGTLLVQSVVDATLKRSNMGISNMPP